MEQQGTIGFPSNPFTNFDLHTNYHGSGNGSQIYNVTTTNSSGNTLHTGVDWTADYHSFQLLWTPTVACKYYDGQIVVCDNFNWNDGAATLTASASSSSTTVTVSSTSGLNAAYGSPYSGQWVTGNGIPAGTYVTNVVNSTSFTINQAATITNGETIYAFNPAQWGAALTIGGSWDGCTDQGFYPTSTSQFPTQSSVQWMKVWADTQDHTPVFTYTH